MLALALASPSTPLPPEAWQNDLTILKQALTTLHPGLHRYLNPAQFEKEFGALTLRLNRPATRREGFLALSEMLAKVQCGHLYPNFFNQNPAVKEEVFGGVNKLPYSFRWIGGKMVVTGSVLAQHRLPVGTEISAVNGVDSKRILSRLLSSARADGGNPGKKEAYLEVTGEDGLEAFDVYHPLYFPFEGKTATLKLKKPGDTPEVVEVPCITLEQRRAAYAEKRPEEGLWRAEKLDDKTTLLSMPGWAFYNTRLPWEKMLNEEFDKLIDQGVTGLILDIRKNEGGLDVGRIIASRITPKPFQPTIYRPEVVYKTLPEALAPYVDTWDNLFKNWGGFARPRPDGRFNLVRPGDTDLAEVRPVGRRFEGKVAVLMGPTNSSATFQFLSMVKGSGLATLIGRTSGGSRKGINGGAFFFLRLPRTELEVDIPLIGYFPPAGTPGGGIEPDIRVAPTAQALAQGRDLELEAALKYLKGKS